MQAAASWGCTPSLCCGPFCPPITAGAAWWLTPSAGLPIPGQTLHDRTQTSKDSHLEDCLKLTKHAAGHMYLGSLSCKAF